MAQSERLRISTGMLAIILTLITQTGSLIYFVSKGAWAASEASTKLNIISLQVSDISKDLQELKLNAKDIKENRRRIERIERKIGL